MGLYAVTGGASGIGASITQALRGAGHEVITIDLANADIHANLATADGRDSANKALAEEAPSGLDGFVACAGVGPHVTPPSMVAKVNFFGAKASVEGAYELVRKRQGSIIIISSQSAVFDYDTDFIQALNNDDEDGASQIIDQLDGQTAYGGSKYALTCWMRRVSGDYARAGVRINALAPGFTETPLNEGVASNPEFSEALDAYKASIPIGFPGSPQDQADAALFLLSDKARFMCGSVVFIDGGTDALMRPDTF